MKNSESLNYSFFLNASRRKFFLRVEVAFRKIRPVRRCPLKPVEGVVGGHQAPFGGWACRNAGRLFVLPRRLPFFAVFF